MKIAIRAAVCFVLLSVLSPLAALAQGGDRDLPPPSGLSTVPFRFGPPGARSLGMGGAFIALADDAAAGKVAAGGLAGSIAAGDRAGTTVSATLVACRLARPAPIRVFATGGIGGVHRGWTTRPDISADLPELERTACCVVCAGSKAVLDVAATLELLETLRVPVLGYRTDFFPRFYAGGTAALPVPRRVEDVAAAARLCRLRWESLEQSGGVLLTQPVAAEAAVDEAALEAVIEAAEQAAVRDGIHGAALTPYLLNAVATGTGGASLRANLALLAQNATLAAELAVAIASD